MTVEKSQEQPLGIGYREPRVADQAAPGRQPPHSQRVYARLRRMLMIGEFRPGDSVSIRTLSKRLNTGAMPVREAITRLIAEQALQMLPNRQVIVPRMTQRKFVELCKVRRMLEGMAAEAASKNADAELLDLLECHHVALLEAIDNDEPARILEKNRDFHFAIYEAANSEILMPMIERLWMQAGPFLFLSLTVRRTSWQATQHDAALEALRQRDHVGVVQAIQNDIDIGANSLMLTAAFDD